MEAYFSKRSEVLPVQATDFVLNNNLQGKMFNLYRFGGYLIHRLYPERSVFIDGRADLYGDAFFDEYKEIKEGGEKARELLDKYNFDYLIIGASDPLYLDLLRDDRFQHVYKDELASIFVKQSP